MSNEVGYIYAIKNLVTGKFYVGQTVNLSVRRYQHFSRLKKGTHKGRKLQNSYNKHGDVFVFGVIEKISKLLLNDRETFWINAFDSFKQGYNCDNGGSNPLNPEKCNPVRAFNPCGVIYEDFESVIEASRATGADRAAILKSIENNHCAKYRKWFYINDDCPKIVEKFIPQGSRKGYRVYNSEGVKMGDFASIKEACQKFNIPYSAARHAIRQSGYCKGYKIVKITESTKDQIMPFKRAIRRDVKFKKIKAIPLNGDVEEVYNNYKEAAEKLNIHASNIGRACKDSSITAAGRKWFYIF